MISNKLTPLIGNKTKFHWVIKINKIEMRYTQIKRLMTIGATDWQTQLIHHGLTMTEQLKTIILIFGYVWWFVNV